MRQLVFILCVLLSIGTLAQSHVRVHYKNGSRADIPIETIDSLTFVEGTVDSVGIGRGELTGSWVWGNVEQGYYEVLTFGEDRTYTGYDNYFTYGFDTWTYGFYSQYGTMLTMWSNGYGYQRRYNWFVTALSENALEVMTKMGPFTYYRLQPEMVRLKVGGEPLSCGEGDSFVFADGVIAAIEDNKLTGVAKGTTYIQKYDAATKKILSYKVVVE
ncbi:MAG: hypothetical protein IJ618_10775 [Prevotella sp.]|nr:hypothetical protein [Prevotella sp.]